MKIVQEMRFVAKREYVKIQAVKQMKIVQEMRYVQQVENA
jgi:hypothetical protein